MTMRRASHAGSWYTDHGKNLGNQLEDWLKKASVSHAPAKAIISPHAGYSYSGPTAAYAFKQIDPSQIDTIFILGPSHHYRLSGCALTQTVEYQTPLYNLIVDKDINKELYDTGKFELMSIKTDEDEHSIEMQLPYIAQIMSEKKGAFKIVPILVGNTSAAKEKLYGELLSKYFTVKNTLFVISSDFCHWGERFSYTYYDESQGEIWRSIEVLDKMGMDLIEKLDPNEFRNYLSTYENTICGNHPISILLQIVTFLGAQKYKLKFVDYSQSSKCRTRRDSSVSYASASVLSEI